MSGGIRLAGLTVRYGDAVAADAVDLEVAPGEAFGLVGESGSGKTTVLRVLAGLIARWEGRAELDGVQLAPGRRDRALTRRAQLVFQDPYGSLHPRHTIDRTLAEPCAIHGLDAPERRIAAVLDAVGLGARFRFRYPHQLSGGQRQRVAIARALILEPAILLLDEPTSALDVSVQAEILNLLRRIAAERRLTLLLVTHNLAVVTNLCSRLAVMRRGRIVERLTADALRAGAAVHPYTQQLLRAARGYDPAALGEIAD